MNHKVAIFGAGAQGRVTLETLCADDSISVAGFIDNNPDFQGARVNDMPVYETLDRLRDAHGQDVSVIVALGANNTRLRIAREISDAGCTLYTATHPSAVISASVKLGQNVAVMPLALVHANARVDDHVIINSGAVVEHDTVVGEGASISPGTQVGGRVTIGACAFIGTGAIILPRVSIGDHTVVAAGALVTNNVPDRTLVAGSPARHIEDIGDDFDWKRLL